MRPTQGGRHGRPAPARRGTLLRALGAMVVALIVAAALVTAQLARPVPEPSVRLSHALSGHTFGGPAPVLPWPAQGQAVVDVEGLGTMGASGDPVPTPTASVAKVMTAYVFLRDHPLASGSGGPTFTISAEEAARLPARKARGESHVDVVANQPFTERQALEALMIVSANNIAHEMARWDAGGYAPFVRKMNATARRLGMTDTTYTDPSGYDPGTVSTASDQVKLLRAAMSIPAFADVVSRRAYVPADGGPARMGGNTLLGHDGVVGGKTGFTSAAGGNYVFAARERVGGVATLIVGAVMAQPGAGDAVAAVEAGRLLVAAAVKTLTAVTLARQGQRVAVVDDGMGGRTPLIAAAPVTVVGWPGLTVRLRTEGAVPERAERGDRLGSLTAGPRRFPLVLDGPLGGKPVVRRLLRLG
ncbi:D-alanyl-D-alanine carboxypeptidase [Actinomadura sp. HBU206391]|uniref:D-alanyl-D-alanine carboxypeptidase family protein n=1 Tax=Actinomadura sp. HBU206391 TaxID=2731692 RepID=UPI002905E3EC|nr:D-alanyl-D-alanine carboxypeptidase [Actinomadura sp. HBU206391]